MSEVQYFTRPAGYDSDAAYCRFDSTDMLAQGVVVTVYGTEREPSSPIHLAEMIPLVRAGAAVKITAAQAEALVTHRSGRT
jgi:hypothetical protein